MAGCYNVIADEMKQFCQVNILQDQFAALCSTDARNDTHILYSLSRISEPILLYKCKNYYMHINYNGSIESISLFLVY